MLFAAVFLALIAAVAAEYNIYRRRAFGHLRYTATFSSSEVMVGDDVYLFEEIKNEGHLPIPYLKADTDLPEGLEFTLIETNLTDGSRKIRSVRSIRSVFVLHSNSRIRRRWRVRAKKRGEYRLGGAVVSVGDILGLNTVSARLEPKEGGRTSVTVLPLPEPLDGSFASSRMLCGDVISALCPVHGRLMVNIEERTVRHRFSVLLNMNSRPIEQHPSVPSDPGSVERCITVAASLLDRIAAEDVPVRLFVNAPPPADCTVCEPIYAADGEGELSAYGPWRGRSRMLDALRALARLPLEISMPPERAFDLIAASPSLFGENENLIVVSPYIDERMLNFCRVLRTGGVNTVFYIATTRNSAGVIPGDVDVFFSL